MIEFALSAVAILQTSLFGKIVYDAAKRKATIRKRMIQIEEIIPEIRRHPNPILAGLMCEMGKNMNENDDDASWRMLGSLLSNYYVLLAQEIDKKYLYQPKFIELTQNAMKTLKEAFAEDSKRKFAEFAFEMSRILFEYPKTEEDLDSSKRLERDLHETSEYLRSRIESVHSIAEFENFRFWGTKELRVTDPFLRFIYFHVIRWCSQLPFEYRVGSRTFLTKSAALAEGIDKSLPFAKRKNTLGVYLTLVETYASLFPKTKPTLSSEDAFFIEKSSLDHLIEYGYVAHARVLDPIITRMRSHQE